MLYHTDLYYTPIYSCNSWMWSCNMDWAPRCKGKLDCTAVSMATLCHCFRRVATQTQVNTTFKTTTLKLPVNCWGVTFQEIADLSVMNNNCHIFEQRHKTSITIISPDWIHFMHPKRDCRPKYKWCPCRTSMILEVNSACWPKLASDSV